jgi:RNA polymerase sigma-70 factor (ECF subfamily)
MRTGNALVRSPLAKFRLLNAESDEALIKAVTAGDQPAMRTLYNRHNDRVFRFIVQLVTDAGRAEDLASEVFLDVWSQADRFEGRSQVLTWILSIARHKALSLLAQRRRRVAELDDIAMELIEDTADTPEQTVLNRDCSAQLRTCLAQMSREHREIIDLVYYHEKSVEEVVEIIHMPRNTVKTRMFYARKRLGRLLSTHRDFSSTSWRPRRHDPPAAGAREHRSPLAPSIPTGP